MGKENEGQGQEQEQALGSRRGVDREGGNQCSCLSRRKYQFMEVNTQRRAAGLRDKIPDIQKTLETVQFLKMRKVRLSLCAKCMLSVSLASHFPPWNISSLTDQPSSHSVARRGTHRDLFRTQRHPVRESPGPTHGGSLPMARREFLPLPQTFRNKIVQD